MQKVSSTLPSTEEERSRSVGMAGEQLAFVRGLVNGVILSLVLWTAAIYLMLVLR